ncbi:hypothetical protein [Aureimonas glaciei]|uniref:Uncharacterized protein n=1 Tax=Aureimonas glaciei TaxID=1776957 RepID=A0A917DCF7_9HYPH|nr:hypothetical protein [Aureimonas glaciei]GGD28592.1 hypothetical protein GCM10011335_34730 [Aureimonas glaciei]
MSDDTAKTALDALVASAVNPSEPVTIAGGEILIRGISMMHFIAVLQKFPNIRSVLLSLIGAGDDIDEASTARQLIEALLDTGPEAISTVVAAGMGKAGDKNVVAAVLELSDDDLVLLLTSVVELTMPRGVVDFFDRFRVLAEKLGLKPAAAKTAESA